MSKSLKIFEIEKHLTFIFLREKGSLAPGIEKKVVRLWETKKKKEPHLHNGQILYLQKMQRQKDRLNLFVFFSDYQYFLAKRSKVLPIKSFSPLGITCFVTIFCAGDEYVLFLRRGKNVTQYPGCWEIGPAGTLDKKCVLSKGKVNLKRAMLEELKEESGIRSRDIFFFKPSLIFLDTDAGVYDVLMKVKVKLRSMDRLSHLEALDKNEVSQRCLVRRREVGRFLQENKNLLVPWVPRLLKRLGVLM